MTTQQDRVMELMAAHQIRSRKVKRGLADVCGLTYQAVQAWFAGKPNGIPLEHLRSIAKHWRCSLEYLEKGIGRLYDAPELDGNVASLDNKKGRRIPLISWVRAGAWSEAIDNFQPGDADDWVSAQHAISPSSFALRVRGESMYPNYLDNDIIEVDPELEAKHNDDVIVRTADGQVSFKRLQANGEGYYLVALNTSWPDRIIKIPEGSVICGVVVGLSRKTR